MTLADIAVIVATLLAVAFLLPQIVKLARTGNPEGVSSTWPALGAVTNAGWAAYLSSQGLWLSVPSAVLMVIFYSTILWFLVRTGRPVQAPVARGVVWAATLGLLFALTGWDTLGVVLGLAYAVQVTPSVWAAYRSPDPSGIAPSTWWISAVAAMLWMYYGRVHADVPIMLFAITSGGAAGLILVRYYSTRKPRGPKSSGRVDTDLRVAGGVHEARRATTGLTAIKKRWGNPEKVARPEGLEPPTF